MLKKDPMKTILLLPLFLIGVSGYSQSISASQNPVVLAFGSTTGTVTLTATGSGNCTWSKYYDATLPTHVGTEGSNTGWIYSTPPIDNATLTPSGTNNNQCVIANIKQGTWYYQVTNSTGTARIAISVDKLPVPANSTTLLSLSPNYGIIANGYGGRYGINNRSMDTLHGGDGNGYYGDGSSYDQPYYTTSNTGYVYRDLQQLQWIDNMRGKWYFSGRDGYGGHNG